MMARAYRRTWQEVAWMVVVAILAVACVAAINQVLSVSLDRAAAAWGAQQQVPRVLAPTPAADDAEKLVSVRSPLAGLFHANKEPGTMPAFSVGVRVEPDTKLGIVQPLDAAPMPVLAGAAGVIKQILIEEGELVAAGQELAKIDTEFGTGK